VIERNFTGPIACRKRFFIGFVSALHLRRGLCEGNTIEYRVFDWDVAAVAASGRPIRLPMFSRMNQSRDAGRSAARKSGTTWAWRCLVVPGVRPEFLPPDPRKPADPAPCLAPARHRATGRDTFSLPRRLSVRRNPSASQSLSAKTGVQPLPTCRAAFGPPSAPVVRCIELQPVVGSVQFEDSLLMGITVPHSGHLSGVARRS
jgi:hypothetical protein